MAFVVDDLILIFSDDVAYTEIDGCLTFMELKKVSGYEDNIDIFSNIVATIGKFDAMCLLGMV